MDKTEAEIKAFDNQTNIEGSKLDKPFLSPFQRYKMLKPYLDSKNSDATTSKVVTDEDRIKSIKQHFDTLTAITAQDLAAEAASKNVVESSDDDDNLEETTIDDYDPDPGDVKKLREAKDSSWKYKKDQKKAAKKRKEGMQQQGQNESAKKEK